METVIYIIAGFLAAIALLVLLTNVWWTIQRLWVDNPPSVVPLVAGMCGTMAMTMLSLNHPEIQHWGWLPMVLDPWSLPYLLFVWRWYRQERKHQPKQER